jgi:hypothetical protein
MVGLIWPEGCVTKRVLAVFWVVVASVFLACETAAQSAPAPANQQLYGIWYTFPLGNPDTDAMRHEFRHNTASGKDEMIVTRLCPGDYRAVTAKAVSPIEISEDSIRVLKGSTDSHEGEGNSVCRVTIEPGMLSYFISDDGNRITLTNPGGNPDLLELARQDATSAAATPSSLYGRWLLPTEEGKENSIVTRLVFYNSPDSKKSSVRQIVSCTQGRDSLIAQVDSPITVTKNQITVLESASHEERDGAFVCKATLTANTVDYVISPTGATMSLIKSGQKPLLLTREH